MTKHKMTRITACLFIVAIYARAAVPDRDWPSVVPTPAIDVPMQDAAITKGPDGEYYLTGTTPASNDPSDFENGRQIRLWKSADLKQWNEVGVVWDIEDEACLQDGAAWQRYMRFVKGRAPDRGYCRGIKAPELHRIKGDWYLCYSLNDQGTGLIRSTSGKPEGPYAFHARITASGGHPSMFEDDDGTVYWLTDGGWMAPLTDDLKALAGRPLLLMPAPDPRYDRKYVGPARKDFVYSDQPRALGTHGAFLFKLDGRYYLTAGEKVARLGGVCDDTFIMYADRLDGPWSERHLMVPHGGGVTVFTGPDCATVTEHRGRYDSKEKRNIDGPQFYASFAGNDDFARCRNRATFLPLEWVGPKRWDVLFFPHTESYPRKPQNIIAVAGPYAHMQPLQLGVSVRDIHILNAPDGYYYLTSSGIDRPGELIVYRSRDLMHWEEFVTAWTYDKIEWLPETPDKPPVIWDVGMEYAQGTYWLFFHIFPSSADGVGEGGAGVLKSASGKPEGPYVSLGKKGGHYSSDPFGPEPRPFAEVDGTLYFNKVLNWTPRVAVGNLNDNDWSQWDYRPVDIGAGNHICHDGWGAVKYIEGLFVYTAIQSQRHDPGWHDGMGNSHYARGGTTAYAASTSPWGPFRNFKTVPYTEYGNYMQDKQGQWWAVVFCSTHAAPWWQKPGLIPVEMTRTDDDLDIAVQNADWSQRVLRIIGGGEVAEVKTVVESLK